MSLSITIIRFIRDRVIFLSLVFLFIGVSCFGSVKEKKDVKYTPSNDVYKLLIGEMKKVLDDEFRLWYPLSIDTVYGGFYSDINYKWDLRGAQNKFIVTQARHIWAASNASFYYKDNKSLVKIAKHGYLFLKNFMWDKEYGGFYNLVDRKGSPLKERGVLTKQAYGNAFAIYGLAAYYKASGDEDALKLAQEGFYWLEKYSYDSKYGGYFQNLSREGIPFTEDYHGIPPKDQNSMIHLLESYTELYQVWPNELLKSRLNDLLILVRDTAVGKKGYLTLFFNKDFTPASLRDSSTARRKSGLKSDRISFGHDVETAYLMLEASSVLGIKNDTSTIRVAKELDDFALKYGWDKENGSICDGGSINKSDNKVTITQETKEWWSPAEAMNSFLIMAEMYPDDPLNYFEKSSAEWDYIRDFLLDHEYGGWFRGGLDKAPNSRYAQKGEIWKCNYHTSRALINCINRLTDLDNKKKID